VNNNYLLLVITTFDYKDENNELRLSIVPNITPLWNS